MLSDTNKTVALQAVIILGMALFIGLARWLDANRPEPDPNLADESLYLNDKTAKRVSLAFNGLAADWYWMRSLQYVGRKVLSVPESVELDSLEQLNLKLLPSLLDTSTTLDPQFMEPYEYAAIVLPAVNVQEAIRITNKGIAANPNAWRLYQHLGYIYWQRKDYKAASDTYQKGSQLPGAPPFMKAMQAKMSAEGGSRSTAREIYTQMYEQSTDTKVQEMAKRRLMQLDSLDQRESFARVLLAYQKRFGRCPSTWKELEGVFRGKVALDQSGTPLDPSGAPYILKPDCGIDLHPQSLIPAR
jgi:tetratricopeptide (TPR) repeat protein